MEVFLTVKGKKLITEQCVIGIGCSLWLRGANRRDYVFHLQVSAAVFFKALAGPKATGDG